MGLTSANRRNPTGVLAPVERLDDPSMSTQELEGDSSDVECPSCGRDGFASTGAMKSHHKQIHGESIAGVPLYCSYCGDVARRVQPSHAERCEDSFCSDRCKLEYKNGGFIEREYGVSPGGVFHTLHWEKSWSVKRISDVLGKHHTQIARWMDKRGVERRSQSEAETVKWRQMNQEERFQQVSHAHGAVREAVENDEWHLQTENPERRGYGTGWTFEKKEQVREAYDRVCQGCGMDENACLERFGIRLDVHHIIPAGHFDSAELRNAMENLVPLCRSCHRQWEGIPLRPQLAD